MKENEMQNTDNSQALDIPAPTQALQPQPVQYPVATIPIPQTVGEVALTLLPESRLGLSQEQKDILFGEIDPKEVEIRPDGKIYLPAMAFREKLIAAFGLDWTIMPASEKPDVDPKLMLWGFYLFIEGKPKAFAWGEMEYSKGDWNMSYGDAMEGCKSNALMRLCKQLGICSQLWHPAFVRKWLKENAEQYWGKDARGQDKLLWRRISKAPGEVAKRRCFALANDLGWTQDFTKDYFRSHCPSINKETGELVFRTTESRTEFEAENWILLAEHLVDWKPEAGNKDTTPEFIASLESVQTADTQPSIPQAGKAPQKTPEGRQRPPTTPPNGKRVQSTDEKAVWAIGGKLGLAPEVVCKFNKVEYDTAGNWKTAITPEGWEHTKAQWRKLENDVKWLVANLEISPDLTFEDVVAMVKAGMTWADFHDEVQRAKAGGPITPLWTKVSEFRGIKSETEGETKEEEKEEEADEGPYQGSLSDL